MHHLPIMQVVWSVLHLLGHIFWVVWPENLKTYKTMQRYWCFLQHWEFGGLADTLRQQQWCYRCKTRTRNAYRHTLCRKMTCSQLLLTAQNDCSVCYLKQDSTVLASAKHQLLTPGYRKQKFSNMTSRARTHIDYSQLARTVRATSRCPHFSLAIIS